MTVLNLGSINIDHVYEVDHFVRPGETMDSRSYRVFAGGKGYNQSIALARAGAGVMHVGRIGSAGPWLRRRLEEEGVDVRHVNVGELPTGHAVIQVVPSGENAIFLYGGANRAVASMDIDEVMGAAAPGDCLLLQNETSGVADAIRAGHEAKLRVVFNPAPMNGLVNDYPLECVDLFILNETEAEALTGETETDAIRRAMQGRFPNAAVVLTLGHEGAAYFDRAASFGVPATPVTAVDTTAAGDTFIGYFLAEFTRHADPEPALATACHAAAVCVTRPGASDSIPRREEVEA